ncbi:hypothetical protein Cgig2_005924 [Carnegiea gigantea]|uniref:Uncharacterized protein n=1 Tax=Carnegiea gigantea TaxID=171969 RepID=A0A9Q1JW69_9CARY|nr:hypothetical protein Cgig2_005924 [Carnegiea gigantea]
MEKEALPTKPAEKHSKKTKASKDKCEEAVSKKAKRGDCHQQATEGGESLQKADVKQIQEDGSALSTHPETQTSSNKTQQEEKTLEKTLTKSEKKQRGEKPGETKKEKPKKKAFLVRRSQRVQNLSKPPVQQEHISKVGISFDTSDDEESSASKHKEREEKHEETKNQEPKKKPVAIRFMAAAFDACVTLGVPIGGREIMESSRSSTDKEYDEVHPAWVKE